MPLEQAQAMADEAGVDLVELVPDAEPPVCRLMDYGKFKFQQKKKLHDQRKRQRQIHIKEIKFRPGTEIGDYQVKLRKLTEFIEVGDRVKVTVAAARWPTWNSARSCCNGSRKTPRNSRLWSSIRRRKGAR